MWVVAAAVVGGYIAADASKSASNKAADAQTEAAQMSTDLTWEMYQQDREDQMPWLDAGKEALNTLTGMVDAGPGEFEESPGYQFRLDEGVKALDRSASAGGNLLSGSQAKSLTEYGQDYASNEYDNFLNQYYESLTPYQSLAGVGQTTANSLSTSGQNAAESISQDYTAAGDATASSYISSANATTDAIQGGVNALGNYWGSQSTSTDTPTTPTTTTNANYWQAV